MDEARIGQKGRNGHRWWPKGDRAPSLADKRFVSTYPYTATRPATDDAVALVLPEVNANTMASCCSIKPDGTARRRSRCRCEEPSTASKACIIPLLHELSRTHGCNRLITL